MTTTEATPHTTDHATHQATTPVTRQPIGEASTRRMRHQGYALLCGALPDDRGRFRATLVITREVWPTRARTIAVAQHVYTSPDDAIQAAQAQGLAWIANYG